MGIDHLIPLLSFVVFFHLGWSWWVGRCPLNLIVELWGT